MLRVFKIGSYWVYFWSNENEPLEPIHVHVSKGKPEANGTKVWITLAGQMPVGEQRFPNRRQRPKKHPANHRGPQRRGRPKVDGTFRGN